LIRVHREQTTRTSKSNDRILHQQLKWPIETIYLGLRPVDNINVNSTALLESWHMYARTAQVEYNTCSLANGFTVGTLAGIPTALPGPHPSVNDINRGLVAAGLDKVYDADNSFADPLNPTLLELQNAVPSVYCTAFYMTCEPILSSITIEAHGIPLYRDIPADFFNHYVPLTYGGKFCCQ